MWILPLTFSILLASTANASIWDPYAELASPDNWDAPRTGQTLMFSGNDPGGMNKDHGNFLRIEPKGATFLKGSWVLAEMEGAGSITRIWVTGRDIKGDAAKINGRISIYIDAKDKPAIDMPIEDFFGKSEPFVPPLSTSTSGGWVNYVPIPFSTYCKVTVTDGEDRYAHRHNSQGGEVPQLYYHVNWRKLPEDVRVEPFRLPLPEYRVELLKKAAGKMDCTPDTSNANSYNIMPGGRLEVFTAEGVGTIREFSVVSESVDGLRLIAYWDGSDEPAIDVPAHMFFSKGLKPRDFKSLPLRAEGATHASKFPMPFAKGARVLLQNNADKEVSVRVKASSEAVAGSDMRFRARYIDEQLAKGSPDLVLLDAKGGSGHFVGAALVLPSSFLEGNESISVDGAKPGWLGTGTEDYFNGGWYFCHGPYDQPFSGCIHTGDYVTAYRFHLLDAVPYSQSIKVTLEHGHANEEAGRARGVVYWYERAGEPTVEE